MAPDRGNFNPGTKHGQSIFLEKSKGLPEDKRLDLSRSNGPEIHKVLRARELNFRNVTDIPYSLSADGIILKSGNLLTQHQKITLAGCQWAGHVLFCDDVSYADATQGRSPPSPFTGTVLDPSNNPGHKDMFYNIVNNNVTVKIIENILTVSGYDDLLELKNFFRT